MTENQTEFLTISEDLRPIRSIWYEGENGGYSVDKRFDTSTSKIVAYAENGQHAFVPFFAVYDQAGALKARVPAHMVTVIYEVGQP